MLQITSLHNPKIKQALHLKDKRDRDKSGLFLIEGYREILRASNAHWFIETLFVCPELFLGTNEPALIKNLASNRTKIYECSKPVFQKISSSGSARWTSSHRTSENTPFNRFRTSFKKNSSSSFCSSGSH